MRPNLRCLGILPLLWLSDLQAGPINWGYSPSDPPPYVAMDGADLASSLTRDLGELVAGAVKQPVHFVAVPNNRIDEAFAQGRIDIICNTLPSWHSRPEQLNWSDVLYEDADVIATRRADRAPAQLDDLQGSLIGTTLGYHYSESLTNAFANGQLTRHDVRDMETRIKMLERGRLDATVEMRRPLQHHLLSSTAAIQISAWEIEHFDMRCAARPETDKATQLIDTIHQLLDQGRIHEVVGRHE